MARRSIGHTISRRVFVSSLTGGLASLGILPRCLQAESKKLTPVRSITSGPHFHWFGYYDKLQFDPTNRYVLGMEVAFENRSPRPEDVVEVGMVDLQDGDRWKRLGQSRAWCWQQGCMLQWLPGSDSTVLWNDQQDGKFVCRILDTKTGAQRTIDTPLANVSPDGKTGLSIDFSRVHRLRPGYGYPGVPEHFSDQLAPQGSGIWKVNIESGEKTLVVSMEDVARYIAGSGDRADAAQLTYVPLFNPDGSRFAFISRSGGKQRIMTASPNGKDMRIVDTSGRSSHFIWRDCESILAFSTPHGNQKGFYVFRDGDNAIDPIGKGTLVENGHCTYLPGNKWILNDTYASQSADRLQTVYLYHVASGRRIDLGRFHSPSPYVGEWRCDTHPRISRDGRSVVIDSPHGGNGRQMYLIDISEIVG